MNVINGNIVALCGIDLEEESQHSELQSSVRVLNRVPLCACYGFGKYVHRAFTHPAGVVKLALTCHRVTLIFA